MRQFRVVADRKTGERAGTGGTFQVVQIFDENEEEQKDLVDAGTHWPSEEALEEYLEGKLGDDDVTVVLDEEVAD
jgi:hypothetical protein